MYQVGIDTINNHPRLKITLLSYLFPDHLDARILGLPNINSIYKSGAQLGRLYQDLLGNEGNNYMNLEQQVKYKFIISLDGHGSSWSRPESILFSNSLLLYQTEYVQWFQTALQAYKHYLPVKYDLSNLIENINWAKAHSV